MPQLADATDAVAKEFVGAIYELMDSYSRDDMKTFEEKKDLLLKLNINCVVCHNRNAIVHKWTDGYPQAGVVYGATDGAHDDPDYGILKASRPLQTARFSSIPAIPSCRIRRWEWRMSLFPVPIKMTGVSIFIHPPQKPEISS